MVETTLTSLPKLYQHETKLQVALHDLHLGLRQLYGARAPRIVLYGSYARGKAHANSDIDVLLLFTEMIRPGAEITRISQLLADLNLRYQVLVSVVPATLQQYQEASGPFWKNIRREGIAIHEF
jgi:predicted nucleotidyltransferase